LALVLDSGRIKEAEPLSAALLGIPAPEQRTSAQKAHVLGASCVLVACVSKGTCSGTDRRRRFSKENQWSGGDDNPGSCDERAIYWAHAEGDNRATKT